MRRVLAIAVLILHFFKGVIVSGWITSRIILRGGAALRPGFVRMHYGDLGDNAASLLAALITLTPGTTAIDIDPRRRELRLHLLDVRNAGVTLAAIRREFLEPIRILSGGAR